MRTVRTKVYKFNELNENAKKVAIEWYRNNFYDDDFAWDQTKDDASEVGLIITSLDDHKANEGEFKISGEYTAKQILLNHGESCETYKTAKTFLDTFLNINATTQVLFEEGTEDEYADYSELNDLIEDAEKDFLQSLLEDYRINFNADLEYQNSDKYIIETIEANEYEFTAQGKRFHS